MSKRSLFALSCLLVFLSGCEWDVTGTTAANQPLSFNYETSAKKMKDRAKKGKELYKVLPVGRYSTELEFAKDHMDLKANKLEVRFLIPKSAVLPKDGGHLAIAANDTAQPYDISADVKVDDSRSDDTRAVESCTESIPYQDCSCTAAGEVSCSSRTAYITGEMDVSYYMSYTQRDITVQLLTPGTAEAAGQFDGTRLESSKIYTYKGTCYVDPSAIRRIVHTERWEVRNCRPKPQPPIAQPR